MTCRMTNKILSSLANDMLSKTDWALQISATVKLKIPAQRCS